MKINMINVKIHWHSKKWNNFWLLFLSLKMKRIFVKVKKKCWIIIFNKDNSKNNRIRNKKFVMVRKNNI